MAARRLGLALEHAQRDPQLCSSYPGLPLTDINFNCSLAFGFSHIENHPLQKRLTLAKNWVYLFVNDPVSDSGIDSGIAHKQTKKSVRAPDTRVLPLKG